MVAKKSKVTQVQANGHWDGQYGLMYKWEVTMENGDNGQYMSKTKEQGKFIVGVEANYTHDISRPDFPKIKPFNDFQNGTTITPGAKTSSPMGSPDIQELMVRQSSLKAAVEFSKDTYDCKEVLKMADAFVAWVFKKECCEAKSGEMQEVGADKKMPF